MNRKKFATLAVGAVATAIITFSTIVPTEAQIIQGDCKKGQAVVVVHKKAKCVKDSLMERRLAMHDELSAEKIDEKGNTYHVEVANWTVFWKTMSDIAREEGLDKDDLMGLMKNGRHAIKDFLNPNT